MDAGKALSSVRILGVRVDDVTMAETLDLFRAWITEGETHQVVTVNPEFVMRAQQDAGFRVTLEEADLAVPDGAGLLWASRLLGHRLRERVAGSDLLPLAAELSAAHGYRIFLLGAAPGVAERTAELLTQRYPKAVFAGTYAGSPAESDEAEIVGRIRAARPDLLFVAYGAPKQDLWIRRNAARLEVPVCMGVGGAFDFIAGVARRAPLWMRRAGLEWLHRLIQEPWRWRRMLALPRFAGAVLWSACGRAR